MIKRDNGQERVILVDDLNPEDVAMVQALYSRSPSSAEVHVERIERERKERLLRGLEEARKMVSARAGSFMSRYYVGYGHKSIADCGTTTLFVEGVSMLCAKALQDSPLYSGQETSTRYMDMRARRVADPIDTPASHAVIERWMTFYADGLPRARDEVVRRHPRRDGESWEDYERATAARAFDVMRAFLPAGTTTQLSWHTNLRQAGDRLAWLAAHPLTEVRRVAGVILDVLREAYPTSFSLGASVAGLSGVGRGDEAAGEREAWVGETAREYMYLDASLPTGSAHTFGSSIQNSVLAHYAEMLRARPRGAVLPHWMSDLGQVSFRFDLDFGSFRDVQRHRNGVCRMPLLSAGRGVADFHPWYLGELDEEHAREARELINEQAADVAAIDARAEAKQYLAAMGSLVPCRLTYALPAAVYVMELRSGRTIHPTLRRAVRTMIDLFRAEHPLVKLHVDESPSDWDVRRGRQTIVER